MKQDDLGNRMKAYQSKDHSINYVMPSEVVFSHMDEPTL